MIWIHPALFQEYASEVLQNIRYEAITCFEEQIMIIPQMFALKHFPHFFLHYVLVTQRAI